MKNIVKIFLLMVVLSVTGVSCVTTPSESISINDVAYNIETTWGIEYSKPRLYTSQSAHSTIDSTYEAELEALGVIKSIDDFEALYNFVNNMQSNSSEVEGASANTILKQKKTDGRMGHTFILASILREKGIPALVNSTILLSVDSYGFGIETTFTFIEAYINGQWMLFHPFYVRYIEDYEPTNPVFSLPEGFLGDEDASLCWSVKKSFIPGGYVQEDEQRYHNLKENTLRFVEANYIDYFNEKQKRIADNALGNTGENGETKKWGLFHRKQNPKKGFHWDYYIQIPNSLFTSEKSDLSEYMVVEPTNTGSSGDDIDKVHRMVRNNLRDPFISDVVYMTPVFPRPTTIQGAPLEGWQYYTHSLDRQTLTLEVEEYAGLDKQLVAMIDDARSFIAEKGVEVNEQVLMLGYSASGNFTNRFAALHPEKVEAIAAGGVNGLPILPLKKLDGKELIYPVGVYDLKELIGKEFDLDEYKKVPQYLYMGGKDSNDTLDAGDAFDDPERRLFMEILNTKPVPDAEEGPEGAKILIDRFRKAERIYLQENIPAQFYVYDEYGHELNRDIQEDVIEFFRKNTGDTLTEISP